MTHSCFIHSSVDGHLGCFHILVIVQNTAMNIGLLCSFKLVFSFPLYVHPELGSLGTKEGPFLIFEVSPYGFPQWLHQSTFPPSGQKGPPCSALLPALALCQFMDDSHSVRCEMTSHYSSNLHFSDH